MFSVQFEAMNNLKLDIKAIDLTVKYQSNLAVSKFKDAWVIQIIERMSHADS